MKKVQKIWNPSPIPWKKYGVHPPFHLKKAWNPSLKSVESIPYSMEKVWNPSGKSMESIHHSMEKYGIHPPFHGIHSPFHGVHPHSMESPPQSMRNNLGRVKYWCSQGLVRPQWWGQVFVGECLWVLVMVPQSCCWTLFFDNGGGGRS